MPYDCEESLKIGLSKLDETETDYSSPPSAKPSVPKQKPGLNISCDKCGKYFRYKWSLTLHAREHENKVYFKCMQCPATFVSTSDRNRHLVSHSTERPFKCSYCPIYCKTRMLKLRHEETHDMTTYYCQYCEATFKRYFLKTIHERTHKRKEPEILNEETGETQYKCLICFSLFSSPNFLKEHIKSKHVSSDKVETIDEENGDLKYKCKLCVDIGPFADLGILLKHINLIHRAKCSTVRSQGKPKNPSLKCSKCLSKFNKSKELRKHAENMHPNDWKNMFFKECPICNKYICHGYLPYHIRLHKGLRPFKCNKCEAAFSCKGDLTKHITRSCTIKKIYQCHWCKEIVSSKAEKDAHKTLHLGRKTHKCDKCDFAFYGSGQLFMHKNKMHMKRMKECPICNKQVLSILFKTHIRRNHERNEKLCDHCGKSFLNEYKLKQHFRQVVKWQRLSKPNTDISCERETISAPNQTNALHENKKFLRKPFLLINFDNENIQQIILNETACYAECNLCGYISYSRLQIHSHSHFEKFNMELRGISTSNEIIKNINAIPVTCPNDKNIVSKKGSENILVFKPPEIIFRPDGGMIRIKPTYVVTSWIYSLKIPKPSFNKTKTYKKKKGNSKIRRTHPSTIKQPAETGINTTLEQYNKPTTTLQPINSTTVIASKKNDDIDNTEYSNKEIVGPSDTEPRPVQPSNRPITDSVICNQSSLDSILIEPELNSCSPQTVPRHSLGSLPEFEKNISAYSATSYLCHKCSRSNNVSSQQKTNMEKDQIMLLKCAYCETINKYVLYSMKLPIWPTSKRNGNGCNNKCIPIFFMNTTVQNSRIAAPSPRSAPIFERNNPQTNRVVKKKIGLDTSDVTVVKNSSYVKNMLHPEISDFVSQSTNEYLRLNLSENIVSETETQGPLSIKELEKLQGCDVDTLLNYLKGK